jgi:hypothetical protein
VVGDAAPALERDLESPTAPSPELPAAPGRDPGPLDSHGVKPGLPLDVRVLLAVVSLALIALAVRLFVGMQEALDADEATEGITALGILHGHLVLMESDGRYLGALDSYLMAPFLAVLGPTLLGVRAAQAFLGALYVGLMFTLGRQALRSNRAGLIVAGIAIVFPLYAVTFGTRARTYGLLLVLETLLLLLWIRLAWPSVRPRAAAWAVVGLVAGIALWTHLLLALPSAVGVLAVLARGRANGWRPTWRGLAVAAFAGVIGFVPWLIYNLAISPLGSLRHLYSPAAAYTTSVPTALRYLLSNGLPIFLGTQADDCGATAMPPVFADLGIALLAVAVLWLRRRSLVSVFRGRFQELEPADAVLAMAPLALFTVTVGFFNALYCEPRYLMPLAVPLVFAAGLVLSSPWALRSAYIGLLAAWLALEVSIGRNLAAPRTDLPVTSQMAARPDIAAAAEQVAATRPEAVWAQYWLARPVQFYAGDRFVMGEYGGYVGFPEMQTRALRTEHPSWLFAESDPQVASFRAECLRRGISYRESRPGPGLVLFSGLSQPLTPADMHLGGQRPDQV